MQQLVNAIIQFRNGLVYLTTCCPCSIYLITTVKVHTIGALIANVSEL